MIPLDSRLDGHCISKSVLCSQGNHGVPFGPVRRRSRMEMTPSLQPARLFCKHAASTSVLPLWLINVPMYYSNRHLF